MLHTCTTTHYNLPKPMAAKRQRALLLGINYTLDPLAKLNGCCNDARNVAKYLTANCGFTNDQITIVVDEMPKNLTKLTKEGITDLLYGLCVSSWRDNLDFVYFHYSGHGTHIEDLDGDEADKQDEGIVPIDYRVAGVIVDDKLSSIFTSFNPKTKITCVFDSCHSGSILDLPVVHDRPAGTWITQKLTNPAHPWITCISGCRDDQTSADTQDAESRTAAGALTMSLLQILKLKSAKYPVLQLVQELENLLAARKYTQIPLLTSSRVVTDAFTLFSS